MTTKHPHQPERFEVYTELKDGSGFKIKGCDYVFKFDRLGGWYDEYANYYNANGKPDESPEDSEGSHGYNNRSDRSYSDHEEDEFEREFGGPKNYEDDYDEPVDINFQKTAANLLVLATYPVKQPFRVNFRNISFFCKRDQVYNHFSKKVSGILNVVFSLNEKGQFNGSGYFVVDGIKSGEDLVKLEGYRYGEGNNIREIQFKLDDVEEIIQDPLKPEDLKPTFLAKTAEVKKYFNANLVQQSEEILRKVEIKKQEPKKKEEIKKQAPKKEEAKKEQTKPVKALNLEDFVVYKFYKKAFPKKSSFKDWLLQNNFDSEVNIRKVQKIENNPDCATVEMKRKIFTALNGKTYNGVKIEFQEV